jgi:hypothetical protein
MRYMLSAFGLAISLGSLAVRAADDAELARDGVGEGTPLPRAHSGDTSRFSRLCPGVEGTDMYDPSKGRSALRRDDARAFVGFTARPIRYGFCVTERGMILKWNEELISHGLP